MPRRQPFPRRIWVDLLEDRDARLGRNQAAVGFGVAVMRHSSRGRLSPFARSVPAIVGGHGDESGQRRPDPEAT